MNVRGSHRFGASRRVVFEALRDPCVLLGVIPGCETVGQVAPDEYEGRITLRLPGAVGSYRTHVRLEDVVPPEHCGLDGRVRFLGRVDDVTLAESYACASVFALPGRARLGAKLEGEGFGLVFLEAAAAGLPCVAGRAGGAVEAGEGGGTGVVVGPGAPRPRPPARRSPGTWAPPVSWW